MAHKAFRNYRYHRCHEFNVFLSKSVLSSRAFGHLKVFVLFEYVSPTSTRILYNWNSVSVHVNVFMTLYGFSKKKYPKQGKKQIKANNNSSPKTNKTARGGGAGFCLWSPHFVHFWNIGRGLMKLIIYRPFTLQCFYTPFHIVFMLFILLII